MRFQENIKFIFRDCIQRNIKNRLHLFQSQRTSLWFYNSYRLHTYFRLSWRTFNFRIIPQMFSFFSFLWIFFSWFFILFSLIINFTLSWSNPFISCRNLSEWIVLWVILRLLFLQFLFTFFMFAFMFRSIIRNLCLLFWNFWNIQMINFLFFLFLSFVRLYQFIPFFIFLIFFIVVLIFILLI